MQNLFVLAAVDVINPSSNGYWSSHMKADTKSTKMPSYYQRMTE